MSEYVVTAQKRERTIKEMYIDKIVSNIFRKINFSRSVAGS